MSITRNDNGTYSITKTVTVSALELYLSINAFEQEIGQLNMTQLAIDAGQSGTTTPPPPPPPASSGKGIYGFNVMDNPAAFAGNPNIKGVVLTRYWAEFETAQGEYDFSPFDNDIKPYADHGQFVILRVSVAGWENWQPKQNSGKGWPQYLAAQGVKYVTDPDKSLKPQYWNPIFLQHLNAFVQAFAARYDQHPNVFAVEMAIGDGGETKPSTNHSTSLSAWQGIGYTDAVWLGTIEQIVGFYTSAFKNKPLILMPNATFIGNTPGYNEQKLMDAIIGLNNPQIWYQDNGLTSSSSLAGSWGNVPKGKIISEQLRMTSQSGDTLAGDLANALKHGSQAILVFTEDLQASGNQAILAQTAASMAS